MQPVYSTSMPQSWRRPQHHKRTFCDARAMSALPPKVEIGGPSKAQHARHLIKVTPPGEPFKRSGLRPKSKVALQTVRGGDRGGGQAAGACAKHNYIVLGRLVLLGVSSLRRHPRQGRSRQGRPDRRGRYWRSNVRCLAAEDDVVLAHDTTFAVDLHQALAFEHMIDLLLHLV